MDGRRSYDCADVLESERRGMRLFRLETHGGSKGVEFDAGLL
jgi:hypothetical protein